MWSLVVGWWICNDLWRHGSRQLWRKLRVIPSYLRGKTDENHEYMRVVDVGVWTRDFASIKPLMCAEDTWRRAEQLQLLEGELVWRMSGEGDRRERERERSDFLWVSCSADRNVRMCRVGEEYLLADSCLQGLICVLFRVEVNKLHSGSIFCTVVSICTASSNMHNFCIVPTQCVCVSIWFSQYTVNIALPNKLTGYL